jgi:hypothetical protein
MRSVTFLTLAFLAAIPVPVRAHAGPVLTAADVDGSGATTLRDVQLIVAMNVGLVPVVVEGDTNGDDIVDDLDVDRARAASLERIPVVFSVEPETVAPGGSVTVRGQGFGQAPWDLAVVVDTESATTAATPVLLDRRTLTATVPESAWSGPLEVQHLPSGEESNAPFLNVVDGTAAFRRNVQPVFATSCTFGGCHGGAFPQENLSLETAEQSHAGLVDVLSRQRTTMMRVARGNPAASYLMEKLLSPTPTVGSQMPLGEPPLGAATVAVIREWIEAGALDD